jgi:hypothetical protein
VKLDRPDRAFVTYPHLFELLELDLPGWFDKVHVELKSDYVPRDCLVCYSPKPNWLVRPGAVLDVTDELVLNALTASFHEKIWNAIGHLQGSVDIAYQFQKPPQKVEWIQSGFSVWKQWREKSLSLMKRRVQFVVFADIAAFYENIDLQRLGAELQRIGVPEDNRRLLMKCLNRWAQPRGKGIPQGYSASDILAKIYMNPVDTGLRNAGFKHLRYVDDTRLFCSTRLEAKQALLKLNDLLRGSGLNLQTAKTRIIRAEDARKEIDGVTPTIQVLQQQLKEELTELGVESAYGTLSEIEEAAAQADADNAPVEVLEQAFNDYFLTSSEKFDKTLLHYLLTRLAKARSELAMKYCIELISARPEETESALRYLGAFTLAADQTDAIIKYMGSKEAIYDYQLYQLVRWFYRKQVFPTKLIKLARDWAFDQNRDLWLRIYSLSILGERGNSADLSEVEKKYSVSGNAVEKAEIAIALRRLPESSRNSFYARIGADSDLVKRAIQLAKQTASD